jgi:hypothetical protein
MSNEVHEVRMLQRGVAIPFQPVLVLYTTAPHFFGCRFNHGDA